MKKSFILDPLWITQGRYLDAEYFNYILLAASEKYKKEIESKKTDHFYEVMFHVLNLNTLAVNGNLFTAKFKEVGKDDRINQIIKDLQRIYDLPKETLEIFKNANYIFLTILVDYLEIYLSVFEKVQMFTINPQIHMEKEIYVVINKSPSLNYEVWKLVQDNKKNFGYSHSKVKTVTIDKLKKNAFSEALEKEAIPELSTLDSSKNLFFAIYEEDISEELVSNAVKDIILLNKGIAKKTNFDSLIVSELYHQIWFEKMIPFTLPQWKFETC